MILTVYNGEMLFEINIEKKIILKSLKSLVMKTFWTHNLWEILNF